jgi:hypothetical protein
MIRRMLVASAIAATALVGLVAAPSASASNVHWNVSIGLPGLVVGGGPGYGYVAPAPVYVPRAPVYVAPPPPVYYPPAPVYFGAPVVYRAPVVYPRPYYAPYYRPAYHGGYRHYHR